MFVFFRTSPNQDRRLGARHEGLVPDTFTEGRELVVNATITSARELDVVPDGIMLKRPSKYDPIAGPSGPPCSDR
jgi:cytochrome c-type biogenesis protein CcmE